MTVHYLYMIIFKLNMKNKIDKVVKFLNEKEQKLVTEENVLKL